VIRASGILRNQPIQGCERAPEVAGLVVGVRQLIKHVVVPRTGRVGPQQLFVHLDRVAIFPRTGAPGEPVLRPFDFKIAETTHCLRTHPIARGRIEKLAIGLDGRGATGIDRGIALHDDLSPLEAPERACFVRSGTGPEQAGASHDVAAFHGVFSAACTARS